MLEIYKFNPAKYGGMVIVDIVVANIWMAILLIGIGKKDKINKWLKADTSAIEELKVKVINFTQKVKRNPTLSDLMIMLAIAFGTVGFGHFASKHLSTFFADFCSLYVFTNLEKYIFIFRFWFLLVN